MSKPILHQTNEMAHAMFAVFGYKVPAHLKMWRSRHPTAQLCWKLACSVQQQLKGADVPAILETAEAAGPAELPRPAVKGAGRMAHRWVIGPARFGTARQDRCACGTIRACMALGPARYYRDGARCKAGPCPLADPP